MLAFITTCPMNRHIDVFTIAAHMYHHASHQATNDLFPIGIRSTWSIPQGGNIGCQRGDTIAFCLGQLGRRLLREAVILLLELPLLDEEFFPAPSESRRYQTVLRVNGLVATFSQLNLIVKPLAPLPPMLVKALTFFLDVLMGLNA